MNSCISQLFYLKYTALLKATEGLLFESKCVALESMVFSCFGMKWGKTFDHFGLSEVCVVYMSVLGWIR